MNLLLFFGFLCHFPVSQISNIGLVLTSFIRRSHHGCLLAILLSETYFYFSFRQIRLVFNNVFFLKKIRPGYRYSKVFKSSSPVARLYGKHFLCDQRFPQMQFFYRVSHSITLRYLHFWLGFSVFTLNRWLTTTSSSNFGSRTITEVKPTSGLVDT